MTALGGERNLEKRGFEELMKLVSICCFEALLGNDTVLHNYVLHQVRIVPVFAVNLLICGA